jgi:hypothetical protein
MPDYTSRADELTKEIDALQPRLPEEVTKKMHQAVYDYLPLRKACLDELLEIASDQSSSNKETAGRWTGRCNTMRSSVIQPFENQLKSITPPEALVIVSEWQGKTVTNEDKFFSTLAGVNAASVRDYLVANQQSLKDYTQTLDEKWKKITGEEDTLHAEEQKAYKEMLELTNKVVKELSEKHKTAYEQIRKAEQEVVDILKVEKAADVIMSVLEIKLPGAGAVVKSVAQTVGLFNQVWLESNPAILGRMANYQSLVQAEKGGILPLFKETRKQVAEYWEKNGIDKAKNMVSGARSSLDSWLSSCPTSAQKDDAKRFYDAVYSAIEKHIQAVEASASEFEKKWNGVFKGALSATVVDDLVDSKEWSLNAKEFVEAGTFAVVNDLVKQMDGYYSSSFQDSLGRLKEMVSGLPEGSRAGALEAVEALRKDIESSIRDRIVAIHQQIAGSLNWFQPSAIEKAFDRSELKRALE